MELLIEVQNPRQQPEYRVAIAFPAREEALKNFLELLELPSISADRNCLITSVCNEQTDVDLTMLNGTEVNIDELNYLTKRLDSFDNTEINTFNAVSSAENLTNISDLINLTFNLHCYVVVTDFNNHEEIARNIMFAKDGAIPVNTVIDTNLAKDMMEKESGVITPYGAVYKPFAQNYEPLYTEGGGFPEYIYSDNPVCLDVYLHSESDGHMFRLSLPMHERELQNTLLRHEVENVILRNCEFEFIAMPEEFFQCIDIQNESLESLNNMCLKLCDIFQNDDLTAKLSAISEVYNLSTTSEITEVADNLPNLEIYTNVHSYEQYGMHYMFNMAGFTYCDELEDELKCHMDFEQYGEDKLSDCHSYHFTEQGLLVLNTSIPVLEYKIQTQPPPDMNQSM